jgi:YD repeat-containing protein
LCGNTQAQTRYNTVGKPIRRQAHDGQVTYYQYDARGRETERAVYSTSFKATTTRPALNLASSVTSTQWHATWNLPMKVAEPGQITAYVYNTAGSNTGLSTVQTTDATGVAKFNSVKIGSTLTTGWSYNASQLPTTVVEKTDAAETNRWTLVYNAAGNLTKITDTTTAQSINLTSDVAGRVIKLVGSNGAQASFTPNARGQLVRAATPTKTVDFIIDGRGLINEIKFNGGRWIKYSYNANQRLIQVMDNMGNIERYTSLEPRFFMDENTVRSAAAWLYLRGKRLGDMLVPEAHAAGVETVALAGGAALMLFIITDTPRRNAIMDKTKCCGQDDDANTGSGDSDKLGWLRQIAVLLSGETIQSTAEPAPIYGNAGLLVSPRACLKPPGNCDPNKWKELQDEVDRACGVPRTCSGATSRSELLVNVESQRACALAREKINKTCFEGGDLGHRNQSIEAWRGVARCEYWLGK